MSKPKEIPYPIRRKKFEIGDFWQCQALLEEGAGVGEKRIVEDKDYYLLRIVACLVTPKTKQNRWVFVSYPTSPWKWNAVKEQNELVDFSQNHFHIFDDWGTRVTWDDGDFTLCPIKKCKPPAWVVEQEYG